MIDGWKNRGLTPAQVPPGEAAAFANGRGSKLYAAYQERLKILNAVDFGDLLLENIRLFREHPEVLRQYQKRFHYILVDEYQDTNVAQYLWLRLLGAARAPPLPALRERVGRAQPGVRRLAAAESSRRFRDTVAFSPATHGLRLASDRAPRKRREGARCPRTSAASATTTSRSTAGAAPRSTTSCASITIFPAPR